MAIPLPPAPVVGPTIPWMLGGQALAPTSGVVPPALLRGLSPAQQIALSMNQTLGTLGSGAGSPAAQVAAQAARATANPAIAGASATTPTAGSAAAPGVAQALGRGGGLAARFAGTGNPTWLTARLAGTPTTGLGLRSLAKGSLGRAGLMAGGGYLAGQGIESILGAQEGTMDDALRNAATGAGIGAGLGSVVPVVGTGVGALLGGGVGFAHGLITGRGSKEGEAQKAYDKHATEFTKAFTRYDGSPDLRDEFLMQFQLATEGLGRKEVNEVAKQMQTMLPQILMQDRATQEQERGQAAMAAAAQAWMAPMLQDAMGRSTTYGDQLSQSMINSAQHIPDPAARAFAIEDARRIPLDVASQQAYSMQMMMSLPGLYGMQTGQGQGGVPQMDFQSIINAMPIAAPNGQTTTFGQMSQQPVLQG